MLMRKCLTNTQKILIPLWKSKAKLVCLAVFCFFNFSCGKQVENTVPEQEVRRPTLNTSFLKLVAFFNDLNTFQDNESAHIQLNANAFVRIPEYLDVIQGNAGNHFARLYFQLENHYSFYCSYQGEARSSSPSTPEEVDNGKFYRLENCYEDVDADGDVEALDYYAGYEAALDKDTQITLEILGADPNQATTVEAFLEVDWH